MKDKDNFMIEGEEMMSCCLTKETHQTAPRLAPDEERKCQVAGRRTKCSENYNDHCLRNASHDQMNRVDRARLVEPGGARDDSPSWGTQSE